MRLYKPSIFLILFALLSNVFACSGQYDKERLRNAKTLEGKIVLERSKDDNPNEFVAVPITECYVALNALPTEDGWRFPENLTTSAWSTLFIEMSPSDVPDGPWNDYALGWFKMMIPLKKENLTDIEVDFDVTGQNSYKLQNNYHGPGKKDKVSGKLHLSKKDSIFIVTGIIRVVTEDPVAVQIIRFSSTKISCYDLAGIKDHFAKKEKKKKEIEDKVSALYYKLADMEREFYKQVTKNYPDKNYLFVKANFAKNGFQCDLLHSLIVDGVQTSNLDTNRYEKGNSAIFRIRSRYDPKPMAIDDETSIYLTIRLNSLILHKPLKAKRDFDCSLETNGWGGNEYSPQAIDYEGEIIVDEISNGLVKGALKINFTREGGSYFAIDGKFVVRVIDLETWNTFDQKRDEIYGQVEEAKKIHF